MIHNLNRFRDDDDDDDDDDADINRHWFVEEVKVCVSAVDGYNGHSQRKCFQ